MSEGFVHSIKVPRLYKLAAKVVRNVQQDGASLKSLVYSQKHPNISGLYALTLHTLQRGAQLDQLIKKSRILLNEPRLDPWLARVLITELIWGKQRLNKGAKPLDTVLAYENKLREEVLHLEEPKTSISKQTAPKPRYVRVNTLLISIDEAIDGFQNEGWSMLPVSKDYSSYIKEISRLLEPYFMQDYHIPELLVFPTGTSFFNHPAYHNGEIILQDKASCLPSFLLNPESKSVVLDMCAAPGMKTSHLAAMLNNQGTVYAVEIDAKRYDTLCEQIEKTNSNCVTPINMDALSLKETDCSNVQYILVDPSCSGSGIVDRPKLERSTNEKERLKHLQSFQVFLLRHALFNFPSVKRIVYSTCSLNCEENEDVVKEVLDDVGQAYKLISPKPFLRNNWISHSSEDVCMNKYIYARPETDLCNGFFIAIFERNIDVPLPPRSRKNELLQSQMNEEMKEAMKEELNESKNERRKKKKRGKKKSKQPSTELTQKSVEENKQSAENNSQNVKRKCEDEHASKSTKKKMKRKDKAKT